MIDASSITVSRDRCRETAAVGENKDKIVKVKYKVFFAMGLEGRMGEWIVGRREQLL